MCERNTRMSSAMLFFFSSRRRHTRLQGDWSSDVCSSDLKGRSNKPMPARDITSSTWQDERTDDQIRTAITDGMADTRMKGFGALGTDRQFDQLVSLIRAMRR